MDASPWKIAHDRLSLTLRVAVNEAVGEQPARCIQVFEATEKGDCPRKRLFLGRSLGAAEREALWQSLRDPLHQLQIEYQSEEDIIVMLARHTCPACRYGNSSHTA